MRRSITLLFAPFVLAVSPIVGTLQASTHEGFSPEVQAQQRVIKGRVLDAKGLPLPGASIQIKDYKGGYLTNGRGEFEIRTDKASVQLTISFLGCVPKTLKAKPGDNLKITLEDDVAAIDEVVVTGFATKRKNSYTGAQTTVKRAELLSRGTKNLLSNLETLVPGMTMVENNAMGSNPNARPEFNIRGRASFEGKANMPVFVVDGSEVSAEYIYDMDMNDIESVTVLKDASASALYGAKASAGVIVITTKALEGGRLKLNYSGTTRFSMPDLSEYHLLNAAEKLEYERLAGIYSDPTRPSEQYELDKKYAELYGIVQSGVNTDWLAKPLRNALSQSHSLSIDGGDTRAKYSVGARYANDAGVMIGSDRSRLSGNFRLSYDVPKKFHITNTFTLSIINGSESPYGLFSDYVRQNPYESPYDAEGNLRPLLSNRVTNPLYEASVGNFNKVENFDFLNTTNMNLWVGENLRFNADFSIQKTKVERQVFTSPKSMSDAMKDITDPSLRGRLNETFTNMLSYQGKLMASYNRYLWGKLYTSAMVGMSMESLSSTSSSYASVGYYTSKLAHPAFASRYPVGGTPSGDDAKATGIGFFTNLNTIWDNKYFLDFIYRYEGSSRFGRDERFAPFWSIGGGWNIHNEPFFQKSRILSLLKLRASMGYLGNISFDPYQAMTTYSYTQGLNYTKGMGAVPLTIGNPDLKWERTQSTNVGIDLNMFGGRLDLTADYYIKNTDNLLLDVTKAPSVGIPSARENLGAVENRGFDLRASVTAIKAKNLQWVLSLNYSQNKNKIKQISNALKAQNEANMSNLNVRTPLPIYEEGQSLTALKVVPSAGIDPATGREIYIKRDGTYSFDYDAHDKVIFGDTAPIGYGSINSYLTWKQFTLSLSGSYSFGGVIYNETLVTRVEGSDPRFNADIRVFNDRWRQPGDVAKYKNIADRTVPMQTSRFVETNNYFTLKTLSLAYDVPTKFVQKFNLRRVRLEFMVNDLLYISNVKRERGLTYPFDRSFEFSLRFSL
ncbi:MAG: SusC/RagA family TonB-linked outer membrane protein [Porphyromonas sp.]|nr:SusC/RagA family TonB-linked outer membrane protein [Porphyromonas sp.]